MHRRSSGFTLVEIMIVILIVALLASIAIPNLLRARVTANESAAQVSLKAISTAMETFRTVNSVYPSDTTSLTSAAPPYLSVNYFTGTHNGYTFTTDTLSSELYSVTAAPIGASQGGNSYTISTGAVLVTN